MADLFFKKTIRVFELLKNCLGTAFFPQAFWFGLARKEVTRGHCFATFECLNSILLDLI